MFVAQEENLKREMAALLLSIVQRGAYLNVSMGLAQDGIEQRAHVQRVEQARVQRMEVVLQRDAFDDEILRDPFPQLVVVVQHFFQFLCLDEESDRR